MPTPVDFMSRYKNLKVNIVVEDPIRRECREEIVQIKLNKYFMMNWADGSDQRQDFNLVTGGRGKKNNTWFQENKGEILNAAMGKGSPHAYELALEWAVRSNKIKKVSQVSIQKYCDQHLGIDCSGFVTNYLIACGKKARTNSIARNTGAASYYRPASAVNDPNQIKQGDLLVWMNGNNVRRSPGHIAIVNSYIPQSIEGGNMSVVESTGNLRANPKLLESKYQVEEILSKGKGRAVMILKVKRHGRSGSRVAVIRV